MVLKFALDETKTPRVLTVTSDRGALTIGWAGETTKAVLACTVSDPAWKLISNDGTTAVFNA